MIAYCGLDCSKCEGYLATQANDAQQIAEVAENWSVKFNADVKPEHVICDGCKDDGRKSFYCGKLCKIRKCCIDKKYGSCIECSDFVCSDLEFVLDNSFEAIDNLGSMIKPPQKDCLNLKDKIEYLIESLESADDKISKDAILSLVEIGAPAVKPLIQAWKVKAVCGGNVAPIKNTLIYIGGCAVEDVILLLKNRNMRIRFWSAMYILKRIKDTRARDPLIEVFQKDEDADVRAAALGTLEEMGPIDLDLIIPAAKEASSGIRKAVARFLGHMEDPKAIGPLLELLKDTDSKVRSEAVHAWRISKCINDVRALEPIILISKDESVAVREDAAAALGKFNDPKAIETLIGLLEDTEWPVRKAAIRALGKTKDKSASELILKIAFEDKDSKMRALALEMLSAKGYSYSAKMRIRNAASDSSAIKQASVSPDSVWISQGKQIKIADYLIPGGLLYVGNGLHDMTGSMIEPALIDPSLPVDKSSSDKDGLHMVYWPSYSHIHPASRNAYLQWLADGCKDPGINISYVFLYFYGLERRALSDAENLSAAKEEVGVIVAEIKRLRTIYNTASFSNYTAGFINAVELRRTKDKVYKNLPPLEERGSELPFGLKKGLAQLAADGIPLPPDWALAWVEHDPERRLSTSASRSKDEFRKLFYVRYREKFGEGLTLLYSGSSLKGRYHPASASFGGVVEWDEEGLLDITADRAPINQILKVVEACEEELALSR
jgi:HEAT repeat protein